MRTEFSLFFGIFVAMALSNAIVPVLPAYAHDPAVQGAIYSAYFLGAFIITLPAGIMSDRYGRITVIRAGLVLTVATGTLLSLLSDPVVVIGLRFAEGLGAGMFVAAALSYVNLMPRHRQMSGYLMAMLNAGLVTGLALSGWLAAVFHTPASGIVLFTGLAVLPGMVIWTVTEKGKAEPEPAAHPIIPLIRDYRWLWYSSIVLIGITGVAASLYPAFSGFSPDLVGVFLASMSIATIVAVLIVSCIPWQPVKTIRGSAIVMAAGMVVTYFSPVGFVILGAGAGFVMIAQMAFLAGAENQGVIMGLFSTSSYLGMTILPLVAGVVASGAGFSAAFLVAVFAALTVAGTIGRSRSPAQCVISHPEEKHPGKNF